MSRGAGGSGCPIPGLPPHRPAARQPQNCCNLLLIPAVTAPAPSLRCFPLLHPQGQRIRGPSPPTGASTGRVVPVPLAPAVAGGACAGGVPRSFPLYCWAKPTGVSREGIPAGRDATDWGQARCHWRRQPGHGGDGVTDGETTCRRGSVGTRSQPRVFWPEQDPCSLNKQVGREEGCNRW